MSDFQLGDRVTITGTAVRVKDYEHGHWTSKVDFIEMGPPQIKDSWNQTTKISEGVVVGKRTVQEGIIQYFYEDLPQWKPEIGATKTVWLVAFHLRRKPVMCFPHQIERMNNA